MLFGSILKSGTAPSHLPPKKILAIKLRAMGDTVLMTAPLIELGRLFPNVEIHALVPQAWAPLLEGIPQVRKIWEWKKPEGKLSLAKKSVSFSKLGLKLYQENYSWVLNFHASPSSALLSKATFCGTRAIHFHGLSDPNYFSTSKIPGKGLVKPIVERDMDVLRSLGLHVPAGRYPKIFLQPHEIQTAEELLAKLNLHQPILGLALGASRPTKQWPLERFTSLALEWVQNQKGSVLALVGPDENHLLQNFLKEMDHLLSASVATFERRAEIRKQISGLAGQPIRKFAAILSRISVLAGNDSGPRHLAVAVGTPTVTLFGPEHPFEWHPYAIERHPFFFIEDLKCRTSTAPERPSWCGLSECTIQEHQCMKLIGVDAVFKACQRVCS